MTRTTFDIIVESMLGGSASLDADRYGPALTGYWPRIRPVSSEPMTRWPMWPRTGRGRPCRLARLLPPGHFRSHAPLPGRAKHRTPPNEPMVLGGVRIGARTASTFQFSSCIETRNRRILTYPDRFAADRSRRVRAMPCCRSGAVPGCTSAQASRQSRPPRSWPPSFALFYSGRSPDTNPSRWLG